MNKKANADSIMKWIFTLIAGAIIFFFFINVYHTYKETAEKKAVIDITMKINNILKNAYGNPNSLFTVQMRGIKMDYDNCNKGLYINRNPNNIIKMSPFAPSHLESTTEDFQLFIMPFKFPFRVDNFVYLTSKNVAYVFFRKDDKAERIKELFDPNLGFVFPKDRLSTYFVDFNNYNELNTKFTDILNKLADSNYYRIYLIFDYDDYPNSGIIPTIDHPIKNAQLKLKLISRYQSSLGGIVQQSDLAYDDNSNMYTETNKYGIAYFDRATLFGALITDNPLTYECVVKKALIRYRYLLNLYSRRCELLDEALQNGDLYCPDQNIYQYCTNTNDFVGGIVDGFLDGSIDIIEEITNQNTILVNTETALGNIYLATFGETAAGAAASLKQLNDYAKNKNCPLIY